MISVLFWAYLCIYCNIKRCWLPGGIHCNVIQGFF